MKNKFGAITALLLIASPVFAGNKETAVSFYNALYAGEDVGQYVADGYVEHQQDSGYTLDGLLATIPQVAPTITIYRAIAQDDLVFLHIEQALADGSLARGELFRFDDAGMLVEHWGVQQAAVPASQTKSGNSMFDGVSEVNADSQAALTHGAAHLEYTNQIWNHYDTDAITASITEAYIQHNPGGVNGAGGMLGLVGFLQSQDVVLEKVLHQTVSEGDFIVKLNFYGTEPKLPGFGQAIVFDIIRLTEDGLADEHWDIAEEIEDINDLSQLF